MSIFKYKPRTKLLILFFILPCISTPITFSEDFPSPEIIWEKSLGWQDMEYASMVAQTNDGGFIIAGNTEFWDNENMDPFLIKIDSNGNLEWKEWTAGQRGDVIVFVSQTEDGGYITFSAYGWRSKHNSNGKRVLIEGVVEGLLPTYAHDISSAISCPDGSFIIVGELLWKIDSDGNILWSRDYEFLDDPKYGTSIRRTSDGGYIIIGTEEYTKSSTDIRVVKINSKGVVQWSKLYGEKNIDIGNDIQQTSDGGYILIGSVLNKNSDLDAYIVKINFEGDVMWTKIIETPIDIDGISIFLDEDGYVIVSQKSYWGYRRERQLYYHDLYFHMWWGDYNEVYLSKIDLNGEPINNVIIDTFTKINPTNIVKTDDGDYVIATSLAREINPEDNPEFQVSCKKVTFHPCAKSVRHAKIVKVNGTRIVVDYSTYSLMGNSSSINTKGMNFRIWKCSNFSIPHANTRLNEWELIGSWTPDLLEVGEKILNNDEAYAVHDLIHPVDGRQFYGFVWNLLHVSEPLQIGDVLQFAAEINQKPIEYDGTLPYYDVTGTGCYDRIQIVGITDTGASIIRRFDGEEEYDNDTDTVKTIIHKSYSLARARTLARMRARANMKAITHTFFSLARMR